MGTATQHYQDVPDAEVVPEEEGQPGTAVAVAMRSSAPTALIEAASPDELMQKASAIATTLKGALTKQGMTTGMGGGREHVDIEGWQTLAGLLGLGVPPDGEPTPLCHPVTGDPLLDEQGRWFGFKATYQVTRNGAILAGATSMCDRSESKWKNAENHAIAGMAQTRAESRAIGAAARWVVKLAGYSGTPTEEMPADGAAPALPDWAKRAHPDTEAKGRNAIVNLVGDELAADKVMAALRSKYGCFPQVLAQALVLVSKALTAVQAQGAQVAAAQNGGERA